SESQVESQIENALFGPLSRSLDRPGTDKVLMVAGHICAGITFVACAIVMWPSLFDLARNNGSDILALWTATLYLYIVIFAAAWFTESRAGRRSRLAAIMFDSFVLVP